MESTHHPSVKAGDVGDYTPTICFFLCCNCSWALPKDIFESQFLLDLLVVFLISVAQLRVFDIGGMWQAHLWFDSDELTLQNAVHLTSSCTQRRILWTCRVEAASSSTMRQIGMKSWLLWYVSILWRYDAIRDEEDNWATWCPHMRDACNISKAEGMRKASIRLEVSLFWTGFLGVFAEAAFCIQWICDLWGLLLFS